MEYAVVAEIYIHACSLFIYAYTYTFVLGIVFTPPLVAKL